jgi:sugar phosphate isomerase/epimerase
MTQQHAGFMERVVGAAQAGYSGIGLRPVDRSSALEEGLTDSDLRAALDSHGIEVVEIEVLSRWALPGESRSGARKYEERLYEIADALGGRHMTVIGDFDLAHDEAVERFAAVCDRAAEHGLRVALEFLPWTGIPDAGSAGQIVADAGRRNGGVLVDSWHHFRGAADDALLTAIPPDRVVAVQFNDAAAHRIGTFLEDTLARRRLPGEGDFDLVGFLGLLAGHGVQAPLCVEVISDDLSMRPVAEVARVTAEATLRILRRAFGADAPGQ